MALLSSTLERRSELCRRWSRARNCLKLL